MLTIIAGLAAIFVTIVVIFTLLKKTGRAIMVIGGMTTIALCWGLVDWQLNQQLEAIICPASVEVCNIDLSGIYEDPEKYERFAYISSLGSMNMKWGWIIWTVFFLIAYFVAQKAKKQLVIRTPEKL